MTVIPLIANCQVRTVGSRLVGIEAERLRRQKGHFMDYEPFHIREHKRQREGQPVVYEYNELPDPFRVQVVRILEQAVGDGQPKGGTATHYADPNAEPLGPSVV